MRWVAPVVLCGLTPAVPFAGEAVPAPIHSARGTLQAAFAPWDNLEEVVVEAISAAKKQVLVQAYLLTSRKIATTLVAAHRRGVNVRVLVDAAQLAKAPPSVPLDLVAAGIPVWIETRYQSAHNKIIVIDAGNAGATVITGSYNFTWTAQNKNAENLLVIRDDPVIAARFANNWERHRRDAVLYKK